MEIKNTTFYDRVNTKINDSSNLKFYLPRFEDFVSIEQIENKSHSGYSGLDSIERETIDSVVKYLKRSHNISMIESISYAYGVSVLYWYRDDNKTGERIRHNNPKTCIVIFLRASSGLAMAFIETSSNSSISEYSVTGIYYSGLKLRYSHFRTWFNLPTRNEVKRAFL